MIDANNASGEPWSIDTDPLSPPPPDPPEDELSPPPPEPDPPPLLLLLPPQPTNIATPTAKPAVRTRRINRSETIDITRLLAIERKNPAATRTRRTRPKA